MAFATTTSSNLTLNVPTAGTWATWMNPLTNSQQVFGTWTASTSTTVTINSNIIWRQWTNGTDSTGTVQVFGIPQWGVWVETEDQRRDRLERERVQREEWQARAKAQEEQRAKAKVRAKALLAMLLNDEQKKELRERNRFHIKSQLGRTYQIQQGRAGNVVLLDDNNKPITRYCIHSTMYLPDEDEMVSQMLLLQADEQRFLNTANATRLVN